MANAAPNEKPASNEPLVSMTLLRHYVPMGDYAIVGHTRPAKKVKNAAGQMVEIEPEAWIEGEAMPPAQAGVGYPNKLWAGTTVRLPKAEAERAYKLKIAERGFND